MSQQLLAESFGSARVSAARWQVATPRGVGVPGLTAASADAPGSLPACGEIKDHSLKPDADGEGVFRLNGDKETSGSLLLAEAIPTRYGLSVEFDLHMYAARQSAGSLVTDGLSFFVIDGQQQSAGPGETGGGLGYRNLGGAHVGVAFDQFGNFSSPDDGWTTGPRRSPNSVAVRGAQATRYAYLTGSSLDPKKQPLGADQATDRALAKRHVVIALSSRNVITVSIDWLTGEGLRQILAADLANLAGQPRLPPTVKIGWAASSGPSATVHEISGFTASTLETPAG